MGMSNGVKESSLFKTVVLHTVYVRISISASVFVTLLSIHCQLFVC